MSKFEALTATLSSSTGIILVDILGGNIGLPMKLSTWARSGCWNSKIAMARRDSTDSFVKESPRFESPGTQDSKHFVSGCVLFCTATISTPSRSFFIPKLILVFAFVLPPEVFLIASPGAGGFGLPKNRDRELLKNDQRSGKFSKSYSHFYSIL